jgi:8-oxo-dGTP pyrophosphatase MutT (NUDIX family)
MPMTRSFEKLIEALETRLQQPLPGGRAHAVMRATPIGNTIPNFEHQLPPKPGSVLILLYPHDNQIYFPLIQRPQYTGAHSGQVSLPGGKAEPGENAIETALREGQEEIGINPSHVNIMGKLSDFFVIPSNFLVTPVVGFTNIRPEFKADPVEVEKIIIGNLNQLLREDAVQSKEILAAGRFSMLAPHFEIDSQIVWGATAMMLNELRIIIKELQ